MKTTPTKTTVDNDGKDYTNPEVRDETGEDVVRFYDSHEKLPNSARLEGQTVKKAA